MLVKIIYWFLVIYGLINLFINFVFCIKYKDVEVILKIKKISNLEFVINTMLHRFGNIKNIIYLNDSINDDEYDIITKIEEKYGIKVINMR